LPDNEPFGNTILQSNSELCGSNENSSAMYHGSTLSGNKNYCRNIDLLKFDREITRTQKT
jgi:hypothetical protein